MAWARTDSEGGHTLFPHMHAGCSPRRPERTGIPERTCGRSWRSWRSRRSRAGPHHSPSGWPAGKSRRSGRQGPTAGVTLASHRLPPSADPFLPAPNWHPQRRNGHAQEVHSCAVTTHMAFWGPRHDVHVYVPLPTAHKPGWHLHPIGGDMEVQRNRPSWAEAEIQTQLSGRKPVL